MITILYFGALKEILGLANEQLEWQSASSQVLLKQLQARSVEWAEALADENIFRLAINKQIIYQPTIINVGDEVAILPPVTGG